jgi:hypothetical protein
MHRTLVTRAGKPYLCLIFFSLVLERGCRPKAWGHVGPSCGHRCHGVEELCMGRARVVLMACLAITHLDLVPHASLASPLVVELPCLCTPSLTSSGMAQHGEPFSWWLLDRTCGPVKQA